jgi:hypothetical protein
LSREDWNQEGNVSELLHRLRRELDTLTDPVARAETIARIAGLCARSGNFDEARRAIEAIKIHFGRGESGRVTIWKMMAEGLVRHYEAVNPSALERINGALVLARAMNYSTAIALGAAWKAHIEFEYSNYTSMVLSLAEALAHVGEDEHDAQTRIAIVLANAFMTIGDREEMQSWFARGRHHAVKNGDRASVDALQYNKAAFLTAWIRVSRCSRSVSKEELRQLRNEVNTARNLQELAQIGALSAHINLVHARLLALEEEFETAIQELNQVRLTEPFAKHNFHQTFIDLEIEFCELKLGSRKTSLVDRYPDVLMELSQLDIDERIVACWTLKEMAVEAGPAQALPELQSELDRLLIEHISACAALREGLEGLKRGLVNNPSTTNPSPAIK